MSLKLPDCGNFLTGCHSHIICIENAAGKSRLPGQKSQNFYAVTERSSRVALCVRFPIIRTGQCECIGWREQLFTAPVIFINNDNWRVNKMFVTSNCRAQWKQVCRSNQVVEEKIEHCDRVYFAYVEWIRLKEAHFVFWVLQLRTMNIVRHGVKQWFMVVNNVKK